MDSSGLGTLVSSFAAAQRQGGRLKLLNLTRRLHDLLVITKLSNVFDTFDDEKRQWAVLVGEVRLPARSRAHRIPTTRWDSNQN
jgi:hypothetical protein